MGYLYVLGFFSFVALLIINITWIIANLYLSSVEGFNSILREESTFKTIYYSIYLRWIIFADIGWLSIAIFFMITRRNYKSNSDLHFLHHKKLINPTVGMVIPAYNEEKSIGKTVKQFLELDSVKHVLIIDNNSTDKTVEIAEKSGAKVIKKDVNKGFAHSVAFGLKEALKMDVDIIGITESDGTSNPYDIKKMIPYFENCDMVIGTRQNQILTEKGNQNTMMHVWGNFCLAKLIQIKYFSLLHAGVINLTDVGCLFRLISKDSLELIVDDLFYPNTEKAVGEDAVHLYLTMLGIQKDLRIIEVPITFNKRVGESKLGSGKFFKGLRYGFKFLWFIIRI
tara:strand:- start:1204 stop:2220 length:1017 start_codon:yes stop_codon:yes gene_type:complete